MDALQVGTLAVGIGGLAVAAMTIYLGRHERTATYRERLYDKLLEACFDIAPKVDYLTEALMNAEPGALAAEPGLTLDDAARERVRKTTRTECDAFRAAWSHWWLILPRSVIDALAAYDLAVAALTFPRSIPHQPEMVATRQPITQVVRANGLVFETLRAALGTDPLGNTGRGLVHGRRGDPMTAELSRLVMSGSDREG
jgi:hypothetical protein